MTALSIPITTASASAEGSVLPVAVGVRPLEQFTTEEPRSIWDVIGSDWRPIRVDAEALRIAWGAEPERGQRDQATDVTRDAEPTTSDIAWPDLDAGADYYCTRLAAIAGNAVRCCSEQIHGG